MKKCFLGFIVIVFIGLLYSLNNAPARAIDCATVDCEEPLECVYTCGEYNWMCEPVTSGCSCSGCRPINTPTPTLTPTPFPTSPPSGCCSTVADCIPTPGYNTYCNESVPGCPVYRCSYKLISCWCPHPCAEGEGGCWIGSDGPFSCKMACCDPGPCPVEPTVTPGGLPHINFPDLIGIATPNFLLPSGRSATPSYIISTLLPYIYGAAGLAMLLFLVLGAYQILVSSGDPKQMASGREKITYAIVGFVIMFAAYWITRITGEILDIQQIKDIFG